MINVIIFSMGILFFIVAGAFALWSANNTRNKFYEDFMRRKSEREKLRVPR